MLPRWVQDYAIVAIVAAVVIGWVATRPAPVSLPPGQAAPALDLDLVGGGHFDLASHQGQPVLVVFWAEWCGACRSQVDDLNRLHAERPDLPIVGVAMDSGDAKAVARAAQRHGIAYPVAVGDALVASQYGVSALPTNVFVGEDGAVATSVVGALDYSGFVSRLP